MGTMNVPPDMLIGDDFAEYMQASETHAKVIPAENYRAALKRAMFTPAAQAVASLPWGKTHDQVQLRPGEVSMWAGANNSGKSMMLSHVVLGLLRQGERACIASFEMKPLRQLERMARQAAKGAHPSEQAVDGMLDWLVGKLWFYDQQGTVKPAMVYAVCRYAADRLKCTHVVIDSLMKCVKGADDYNAQKDFVDELTAIARDLNIHIHLVHHIKKPEDEAKVPGRYDAKGAGEISDQVDNAFMVWRNKPKERIADRVARGESIGEREQKTLDEAPDVLLICDKQRNGEWNGGVSLWFHAGSLQYCADKWCRPADLIADDMLARAGAFAEPA